jgi:hypothetical protein
MKVDSMSAEVDSYADPRTQPTHQLRHYARVLLLCLMQLMLVIDTSVVNVALPDIKTDLGFSATALTWVITAYSLVFGGLVLLSGRLVPSSAPGARCCSARPSSSLPQPSAASP